MAYLLPCGCVAAAVVSDADHVCTEPTAPVEVDLSVAASMLLLFRDDPLLAHQYRGALAVWSLMTGLEDGPAVALAERITRLDDTLYAYTPTL